MKEKSPVFGSSAAICNELKVYLFLTEGDDKIPQKVIDSITKKIDKRGGKVAGNIFITTKMNSVIAPEAVSGAITEWLQKEAIK